MNQNTENSVDETIKLLESTGFFKMHYFDTCSINWLVDYLSTNDCLATRKLIKERGKTWVLSPLNLYEIFSINNNDRREHIIHKLSHLFPQPAIFFDNPTRILFGEVLSYYTDGLTDFENSLKETWFDVIRDPRLTFNLDYEDFRKRRKVLEMFTKAINFVLKNNTCIASKDKVDIKTRSVLEHLKLFKPSKENILNNTQGEFYTQIIVVFAVFCFGLEPQNDFIDGFWESQEIEDFGNSTLERLIYLYSNYEDKINESPQIDLMVQFLISEHKNKGIGRGSLSDSLHLTYSHQCFYFFSDDNGILTFSKNNTFLNNRVYSVENNFSIEGEYYLGKNIFLKIKFWIIHGIKKWIKKQQDIL